jgi:hypothetical protein
MAVGASDYKCDKNGLRFWQPDGRLRVALGTKLGSSSGLGSKSYVGETEFVIRRDGTGPSSKNDDVLVFSSHYGALWLGRRGGNQAGALIIRGVDGKDIISLDGETGDIRLYGGADLAEEFQIAADAPSPPAPGAVVVANEGAGVLECQTEYDPRVVGIVSGAGGLKPGIVLDKRAEGAGRVPIALAGKAYCKVDASCGSIAVGDLLVSSPTPGHAMKCADRVRGIGCVVGKALQSLGEGRGEILVLVGCR